MDLNYVLDYMAFLQIALQRPLDETRRSDGWTEESSVAMYGTLSVLKTSFKYTGNIPPSMLTRALNQWGIVCGDLYERIKQLETMLETNRDNV